METDFIEIQQTWWHIEDEISPSYGRKIRQVMDIYTDKSVINVPLSGTRFIGLKIIGRNINKELAFTENDDEIRVNLGNLKEWPLAYDCPVPAWHVKLEINYTIQDPSFIPTRLNAGYKTAFGISGQIQPEFYITVPLGMEIKNKGQSIRLFDYRSNNSEEHITEITPNNVYLNDNEGKKRYNVVISSDDYLKLKDDNNDYDEILFGVEYEVNSNYRFKILSFFAFLLLALSIFNVFINSLLSLPYLILIPVLTIALTLYKDRYEIPWERAVFTIISLSIILLILKLPLYGNDSFFYNNSTFLNPVINGTFF